jgi:hypothetical protein
MNAGLVTAVGAALSLGGEWLQRSGKVAIIAATRPLTVGAPGPYVRAAP